MNVDSSPENDALSYKEKLLMLFKFVRGCSRVLLIFAVFVVVMNSIGNFLHAPIGIKDNPPAPGLLAGLAQMAIVPLVISYLGSRVLVWFVEEHSLFQSAFGCVVSALCGIGALWILQDLSRRLNLDSLDLARVWIAALVIALLITSELFLGGVASEWKPVTLKLRLGIGFLFGSTVIAEIAVANSLAENFVSMKAVALSTVVFVIGLIMLPDPDNAHQHHIHSESEAIAKDRQ